MGMIIILDDKAPVALYYQLKEILAGKLKSNEWTIGSKIPTERELCDLYKVSRITVRQALNDLENEGYLSRKQGKGTYVTAPRIEQRLSRFYSFSEEIRKMGFTPDTKVISFDVVKADKYHSGKLNTEEGTEIYSIRRLRLADNKPFAMETSFIPCNSCPGLTSDQVSGEGLYNTMKTKYNINPSRAEEVFCAALVTEDDALYLQVKKNSPGLYIERFTYNENNQLVEYCEGVIRGDRYKYRVSLK